MYMSLFNTNHGFTEALGRGLKQGLLTPDDYRRLQQCDSLEDIRSALEETDYGSFLQDEASPLSLKTIATELRKKLANELQFIRSQSTGKLVRFLDYISAEKMIDNLITLLQGALNKRPIPEILAQCNPIGMFQGMKIIATADTTQSYDELYRTILIETPIGTYVEKFLEDSRLNEPASGQKGVDELGGLLSTVDLEVLRNVLKKNWMEDYYHYCNDEIRGETAAVMSHILKSEADLRTLSVTLNTLVSQDATDRFALFSSIGYLYPEATMKLRTAYDLEAVRKALDGHGRYKYIFESVKDFYAPDEDERQQISSVGHLKTLEDLMYKEMGIIYEGAFEPQQHFGVFYSWVKLREQEIRNIIWIADMIIMDKKEQADQILLLFKPMI